MSRENVEIVGRAVEALFREDMEQALADLALDAEILDYDIPDASGQEQGPSATIRGHRPACTLVDVTSKRYFTPARLRRTVGLCV